MGIRPATRLKAVSRMRVATMSLSSSGALAIENVRTLPSASVSGGSMSVRMRYCPALKVKPTGFSNRKASVLSATSRRSTSLTSDVRMAALLSPVSAGRSRRAGRHRPAQHPSGFVQVALETDPRVRAIAERLVRRLAAAAQPRLIPVDRDPAAAVRDDLEGAFHMVGPVVCGRDRDVAHVKGNLPAGGKDLETGVLERVEILDQIARDCSSVKPPSGRYAPPTARVRARDRLGEP